MGSPPDWQLGPPRRKPRTLWSDLGGLWAGFRRLPVVAQVVAGLVAAIIVIGVLSAVFRSGSGTEVSSRSTTTVRRVPTTVATTTTTVSLPPGDDRKLKDVIDGDSLELDDGTKVRLIGIDAPDVETLACYSNEATAHLRQMIEGSPGLHLVYDTVRTDKFGRTLAYVYRLPDGLFVNVTMAKEGYARAQPSANTTHDTEINSAADEAHATDRGLWGACPATTSTTKAASTATTSKPSTTVPASTTTSPPPPTTTAPPASTTTSTPNNVAGPVKFGTPCAPFGAVSYFEDGTTAVCAPDPQGFNLWRKI